MFQWDPIVWEGYPRSSPTFMLLPEGLGPFPSAALRGIVETKATISLRPPHREEVGEERPPELLPGLPWIPAGVSGVCGGSLPAEGGTPSVLPQGPHL